MNHSVKVLISEKYGKHLYAGRKKHMTINSSRIELKALPNHKPCKKLRGQTPSITRSIPAALFSSRFFLHTVHVINFTSHHGNLSFFPFDLIQSKNQEKSDHLDWMKEHCFTSHITSSFSTWTAQTSSDRDKPRTWNRPTKKKGCYKWINL